MIDGIFPELFLLRDPPPNNKSGGSFWVHGHCAVACNLHTHTELQECIEYAEPAHDSELDSEDEEPTRKMSRLIEINK